MGDSAGLSKANQNKVAGVLERLGKKGMKLTEHEGIIPSFYLRRLLFSTKITIQKLLLRRLYIPMTSLSSLQVSRIQLLL